MVRLKIKDLSKTEHRTLHLRVSKAARDSSFDVSRLSQKGNISARDIEEN